MGQRPILQKLIATVRSTNQELQLRVSGIDSARRTSWFCTLLLALHYSGVRSGLSVKRFSNKLIMV